MTFSLVTYWGGPSYRWGGPSGQVAAAGEDRGYQAKSAASLRRLLKTATPLTSPNVDNWSNPLAASTLVPDATSADPRLMSYDAAVRQAIVVNELASAIGLRAAVGTLGLEAAGHVIAALADPTGLLQSETTFVEAIADDIDAGQAPLPIEQLVDEDLRPLLPYRPVLGLSPASHPATFEVLDVAMVVLGAKIFSLKHQFGIPRPHTAPRGVVPMLDVPTHLAYPGGHAAQCYLAATLLAAARPSVAGLLLDVAGIVADNRVRAGLHYALDSAAGEVLGRALGNWLVAAAADPASPEVWEGAELKFHAGRMQRNPLSQVSGTPDLPNWRALVLAASQEW
ncbi:MAG: phosphatase PAP2 family protein [Pseudomonadota bacterium]